MEVADLRAASDRWPSFVSSALDVGIRSVAAVPAEYAGQVAGAVSLYSTQLHDWTALEIATASMVGGLVGGLLACSDRIQQQQEVVAQLEHALDSRVLIEQAKGFLAATEHISIAEAFERMRRHARSHEIKLAAVAAAVVDGSEWPTLPTSGRAHHDA